MPDWLGKSRGRCLHRLGPVNAATLDLVEDSQEDQRNQRGDLRRIHAGARGVILDWYGESGVPPSKIWHELLAREGISTGVDVYQEIFRRYGEDEFKVTVDDWREREKALDTLLEARSMPDFLKGEAHLDPSEREIRSLLLSVPDGLFLNAVPAGFAVLSEDWGQYDKPAPNPSPHFNGVFEKRNVPYRFDSDLSAGWHGDKAVHDEVVEPTLSALSDERLGVTRGDFDEALAQLRVGTAKARKDAVNHGVKAVEGVLKAVLQDRGLELPPQTQARRLWSKLQDAGVVLDESEPLVDAATRVSNKRARHSSSDEISGAEAEASVMSAAVAVRFFSSFLT
jgi:hypothetical protein